MNSQALQEFFNIAVNHYYSLSDYNSIMIYTFLNIGYGVVIATKMTPHHDKDFSRKQNAIN